MAVLLDVVSRLPRQVWYEDDSRAHDQRFWARMLASLALWMLLILDLGFLNYAHFDDLTAREVFFLTRAAENMASRVERVLQANAQGRCSITDGGVRVQATRLGLAQHQGPCVRVHREGTFGGPHRPTVEIDDIEVGVAPLAPIDFVQRQCSRGRRRVGGHPCTPSGLHNDGADRAHANVLPGHRAQAGLNAPRAGVALNQQGQDRPFEGRGDAQGGWGGPEDLGEGLAPALGPSVERLARNAQLATELGDDAIVAGMRDHVADDLGALS